MGNLTEKQILLLFDALEQIEYNNKKWEASLHGGKIRSSKPIRRYPVNMKAIPFPDGIVDEWMKNDREIYGQSGEINKKIIGINNGRNNRFQY